MRILVFDPSGNYAEGLGTSGVCLMAGEEPKALDEIRAKDFECAEDYWYRHIDIITKTRPDIVVLEGYRLYHHKKMSASSQANSELETPQLIGALRLHCHMKQIRLVRQYAYEVKQRWSEKVLENMGILEKRGNRYYFRGKLTNSHMRDALKHGLHFGRYGK